MLTKKRFGLSKVVYEIEGLLLNSKYLENRMYLTYLTLGEDRKEGFRKEIEKVIKKYILNDRFLEALAKDIIIVKREGEEERIEYNIKNYVFKYMKSNLYKGDSRALLIALKSALEKGEDNAIKNS